MLVVTIIVTIVTTVLVAIAVTVAVITSAVQVYKRELGTGADAICGVPLSVSSSSPPPCAPAASDAGHRGPVGPSLSSSRAPVSTSLAGPAPPATNGGQPAKHRRLRQNTHHRH